MAVEGVVTLSGRRARG